jgi:hypothetical protein
MFSLPTQKQSIWQILKNSVTLGKTVFNKLILLALFCSVISTLPHYYIPEYYYPQFTHVLHYIVKHPFILLSYFILTLILFTAVLYQLKLLLTSNKTHFLQAFLVGLKRLPFTFLGLVVTVVMVFIFVNLFVIPGYMVAIFLSMYLPLIILENEGPIHAYKHSYHLVWHDWWRTAIVLAIPNLLFWSLTHIIEGKTAHQIVLNHAYSHVLWMFYHLLWTLLYAVFIVWASSVLLLQLNDLKIRKGERPLQIA